MSREEKAKDAVVVSASGEAKNKLILDASTGTRREDKYTFDRVFGPEADQASVFEEAVRKAYEPAGTCRRRPCPCVQLNGRPKLLRVG